MFPGLIRGVGGGAADAHAHGSWDEAEDEYDDWCGGAMRAGAHDDDDDGEDDDDDNYDNADDDDAGDEHGDGNGSGSGSGGGGWASSGGGPHIEDVD